MNLGNEEDGAHLAVHSTAQSSGYSEIVTVRIVLISVNAVAACLIRTLAQLRVF